MLAVARPDDGGGLAANPSAIADNNGPPTATVQRFVDVNGVPRRVPKLAVRNRTTTDESTQTATTDFGAATVTTAEKPARPMQFSRSDSGGSWPPSSRSSQRVSTPRSTRSLSDEALPTQRSYASSAKLPKETTKKKKGGVLGFLTLKEPSTSAWEEFAEAEKERARQKGVKIPKAGLPGVSSQKLPAHVPKVNSKWDGLPDNAKRTSTDSKGTSRRHGHWDSTFSHSTKQTYTTPRTSASARSFDHNRASSTLLQSPRSAQQPAAPWSAEEYRVSTSSSGPRSPRYIHGSGSQVRPIEESDENGPQTFLLPPSPDGRDKIVLSDLADTVLTPLTPPELDADQMRYFQDFQARKSQDEVEIAEVPATPPTTFETTPALVGIHYPELESPDREVRNQSPAFVFHTVDGRKSSVDLTPLGNAKRQTINFSRPRSPPPPAPWEAKLQALNIDEIANKAAPVGNVALSPSLKEPFLTDTYAAQSRLTGQMPSRMSSTIHRDAGQAEDTVEAEDSGDDSSDDEQATPGAMPDEPDFSVDEHPEQTDETHQKSDVRLARSGSMTSLSPSLAPSIAPSMVSERWNLSPKERLGLGSKIRKSQVVPWEDSETNQRAGGDDRATSPVPDTRRKRMSLRLSARR